MATSPRPPTKGYVTTYRSVAGLNHAQLEEALGFGAGTLSNGYRVYKLIEPIGPNDFEWKDRTMFSGGWSFDGSIGEHVQRIDEFRAYLGKKYGYDDSIVDKKLASFQAIQTRRLNVRSGPDRIVKIVPNTAGDTFPDSPFGDIPQWRLTADKTFAFIGTSI